MAGVIPGVILVACGILYGWTRLSQWKDRYLKTLIHFQGLIQPIVDKYDDMN